MHRPANLPWSGDFPYDVLAPAGVTPGSRMVEVVMAMAHFTRHPPVPPAAHRAWADLGKVEERLFLDFFLYRHDPAGPGDGDG